MGAQSDHETSSEDGLKTPLSISKSKEGSAAGWCTIVGGWLAAFATFGYISAFGVYQDLYTRAETSSSSNISWIGSAQLFFFILMALPAGALLDKGYFKHVVLIGSIIYIFSLFMLSLAHITHYYQIFLPQGVGMGIGSGLIYLPSVAVQSRHWPNRRAFAMGVVITGSAVGGIVYPIMLNNLFHGSVGFAWGVRGSAFMTLGVLAIANYLMTPGPQTTTAHENFSEKEKAKPRDLFIDIPYLLSICSGFVLIMGFIFPFFYLQLFTILHGLPPTFAFYTLTIQNGAAIFGRVVSGLLADRFGVLNICLFIYFGTGVTIFGMLGVKSIGAVVVFAIFYGFFSGGVFSLFAPCTASFARHPSEIGSRMGFAYAASSLAWLAGPPIHGALVGNGTHWTRPIVFSGVMTLASLPVLLITRNMQAKRKNTP